MMVTDNCLDVTANWSPITGECSNSTFNVTLLSASGNRVMMTNGTSYTFDNTVMLSGDISVSVVAFNGDATGATNQVDAQPSLTSKLSNHVNKLRICKQVLTLYSFAC